MGRSIKESKYSILSWAICTLSCFLIQNIFKTDFFYDANQYWQRGEALWEGGYLDLLSINGFRGYVFPLFLGVCNHYAGRLGWRVMNAAMISSIFTIIVPVLEGEAEQKNINDGKLNYRAFFHYFVFTILFMGLEIQPLSDIPAVFLCLLASYEVNHILEEIIAIKQFLRCILFGALVYAAYNVRTIYIFAAVYLIGYLIYKLYKTKAKVINMAVALLGSAVGFIVTAIPQVYMNYHEHGKFSIWVITDGLMTKQLFWGMQYQSYATYVSDDALTNPGMCFMDNVGVHILQNEGIVDAISLGQYLRICLKYPFEMLSIYGRHFINHTFSVF